LTCGGRRRSGQRGKHDQGDALVVARIGLRDQERLPRLDASVLDDELKLLADARDQLIVEAGRWRNSRVRIAPRRRTRLPGEDRCARFAGKCPPRPRDRTASCPPRPRPRPACHAGARSSDGARTGRGQARARDPRATPHAALHAPAFDLRRRPNRRSEDPRRDTRRRPLPQRCRLRGPHGHRPRPPPRAAARIATDSTAAATASSIERSTRLPWSRRAGTPRPALTSTANSARARAPPKLDAV
jgi:hypothetical protein